MLTISFSIFKGGTGKTTTAVNAAYILAQKQKKVLLIDLDQQASATRYFDIDPDTSPNLYQVYMGTKSPASAVRKTKHGVFILPSHPYLAAIEEALEPGDELKLADIIRPIKGDYDFVLIDTPPGKAMLAFNGLAAADLVVIPASAERMAVDGVADLVSHVQRILWGKFALDHQQFRILFTMYRATTAHSPAIVENAQKIWRDNVLHMKIPHSTLFAKSYDQKKPVALLSPKHPGTLAYMMFADWLLDHERTTT